MAAGHGGARPGAGRKRKADKHAGPIAEAEQKIADRLPTLIDNLFVLADGVTVEVVDREGGVDIYTKPPSLSANQYLINRILGRPTQAVEVSGPDGSAVPVDLSGLPTHDLLQLRAIADRLADGRPGDREEGD